MKIVCISGFICPEQVPKGKGVVQTVKLHVEENRPKEVKTILVV